MIGLHIISGIWGISVLVLGTLWVIKNPVPRQFPKGHIRAYDPTGEYTYADQNPALRDSYPGRIHQDPAPAKEYFTGGLWDKIDASMPCATPKIYHTDGTWDWAE